MNWARQVQKLEFRKVCKLATKLEALLLTEGDASIAVTALVLAAVSLTMRAKQCSKAHAHKLVSEMAMLLEVPQ